MGTIASVQIHLSEEATERRNRGDYHVGGAARDDDREILATVESVMRLQGWSYDGDDGLIEVFDADGVYLFTPLGEPR